MRPKVERVAWAMSENGPSAGGRIPTTVGPLGSSILLRPNAYIHVGVLCASNGYRRSSALAPASLYLLHPWSRAHPCARDIRSPWMAEVSILQEHLSTRSS